MHIVDTASPSATPVARTADGKVDLDAYIGLNAAYKATDNLYVGVVIKDARTRFGHLDLLVSPRDGMGQQWVERKNLNIALDPAKEVPISVLKPEEDEFYGASSPELTAEFSDIPAPVITNPNPPVPPVPSAPVTESVEETPSTNLADEVRAIINRAAIK